MAVKIYHGYGHTHDLIVFGHVFKKLPAERVRYSRNVFLTIYHLLRLFFVKPLPGVAVRLIWYDQLIESRTEDDGFFKLEWQATHEIPAGWHQVTVQALTQEGMPGATGHGLIFIPHSTQYGFISDIDDTIMISHSATKWKRLRELFSKNPHTRGLFAGVVRHYTLLSAAHTSPQAPNPFFYVSSSEWNLYDYLHAFFDHNRMPEGAFLLNQVKRWYELWKTGKTKHQGKLLRIVRILHAFPGQRFALFGDNTQSDPAIYATLAERYPQQIYAVYIRNADPQKEAAARDIMTALVKLGVHACFFTDTEEAIRHSRQIGLIAGRQP